LLISIMTRHVQNLNTQPVVSRGWMGRACTRLESILVEYSVKSFGDMGVLGWKARPSWVHGFHEEIAKQVVRGRFSHLLKMAEPIHQVLSQWGQV